MFRPGRRSSSEVIQPSVSEWASPPVLVRKRDGGVRWCVDYRALNSHTTKDVYPLPLIEECLDTLSGHTWFSKLDANSAYWQVHIKPEHQRKTAFTTKYGLFEFNRMPFGLCNAPATFSRVMNLVLRGLTWDIVLAFLDDILVLGTSFENHLDNLTTVFERLRQFQLKLKPRKCELFQSEVVFLGRIVRNGQIELDRDSVSAVKDWPIPRTTKDVERFVGFANYHRSFIKDFTNIAIPLYGITGKKPFYWDVEQQNAFDKMKNALLTAPVLV